MLKNPKANINVKPRVLNPPMANDEVYIPIKEDDILPEERDKVVELKSKE